MTSKYQFLNKIESNFWQSVKNDVKIWRHSFRMIVNDVNSRNFDARLSIFRSNYDVESWNIYVNFDDRLFRMMPTCEILMSNCKLWRQVVKLWRAIVKFWNIYIITCNFDVKLGQIIQNYIEIQNVWFSRQIIQNREILKSIIQNDW